jgi:Fe2+ transport system protein FeoA
MPPNKDTNLITLADIPQGKTMKIVTIEGSAAFLKKLDNLAIRVGNTIVKVNAHILKGPIIINVKNSQMALGHAMAKKIWGTIE